MLFVDKICFGLELLSEIFQELFVVVVFFVRANLRFGLREAVGENTH